MFYLSNTPQRYIEDVNAVVSLREAANAWHVWPKTITRAIDSQRLVARKLGKEWIISVSSLRALWGEPQEELPYVTTLAEFARRDQTVSSDRVSVTE